MTTEDDFRAALFAHPDDHQTRLVFADWLEERGDPRAAGYRAMGTRQVRPHIIRVSSPNYEPLKIYPDVCQWGAADNTGSTYLTHPEYCFAILPRAWFDLLVIKPFVHEGHDPNSTPKYWKVFATTLEGEDAAALAYAQLPPELQVAFLNPAVTKGKAKVKAKSKTRKKPTSEERP